MPAPDYVAGVLLTRILWTSLQAAALVGLIALLIRVFPRLPAAARCTLWWLVGIQVVVGLCWQAPILVPVVRTPVPASFQDFHTVDQAAPPVLLAASNAPGPTHRSTAGRAAPATSATHYLVDHWRIWLTTLWGLALGVQAMMFAAQRRRLLALSRDATLPTDDALQTTCRRVAQTMGMRRCPRVLVSPDIASPMITGVWRPRILWPADHALTYEEAALALAHELAHLKRGDLWLGLVPALAQWLFFFHPLVRRAVREYAFYREAACDAQVLGCGHGPREYGDVLLRMGVVQPLRCGLGGASSTFGNLKRRLLMLNQQPSSVARLCGWFFAVIVFAAALPYRVVVAQQTPASVQESAHVGTARSTALAPKPRSSAAVATASQTFPTFPQFPDTGFSAHHVHVDIDSHAPVGIALFEGDLVVVEGDDADMSAAKRLYRESHGPTLWFRQGADAYQSNDQATVARAKEIFAPVIAVRQSAAGLEGKKWQFKGPLEGLQHRRHEVDTQIHALQADPGAPAATERLASLNNQKRGIDADMTGLKRQLASLKPKLNAMSKRLQQVTARADGQVAQLVHQAARTGKAQKVGS